MGRLPLGGAALLAVLQQSAQSAGAEASRLPRDDTLSPPPGWLGAYHAAAGVVQDGQNSSAFDVGGWGIVAPANSRQDGGWSFEDDVRFHCRSADVNQLWGMLIPHSGGGTFNNTNDTGQWSPLNHTRPGPDGPAGMLQGAARWSTLARTFCPQIGGVVIDGPFWANFQQAKADKGVGDALTAGELADIKAALKGNTLFPNGTVDHSSTATTPHLRLVVVTYDSEIEKLDGPVVQQGIVTRTTIAGIWAALHR